MAESARAVSWIEEMNPEIKRCFSGEFRKTHTKVRCSMLIPIEPRLQALHNGLTGLPDAYGRGRSSAITGENCVSTASMSDRAETAG